MSTENDKNLRALLSRSRCEPAVAGELGEPPPGSGGIILWVREQLDQDPTNPDLKDWLASLLYANKQYDEARKWLTELISTGHSNPARQYQLACCYAMAGRVHEAMGHWEEVILTSPGSIAAQKARERLQHLRESHRTT